MTVKEIVIKNPTGLHARPASEFTRCAAGFKSKITVNRPGEKPVNAKSIIMVLAQSFIMGTTVVISADGEDGQRQMCIRDRIPHTDTEAALKKVSKYAEKF